MYMYDVHGFHLTYVHGSQFFITDIHRSLGQCLLFIVHVTDVNLTVESRIVEHILPKVRYSVLKNLMSEFSV